MGKAGAGKDADRPPGEDEVAKMLGRSQRAFAALRVRHPGRVQEWRRYSKSTPWVLKVSDAKRALFYAKPESKAFVVTVLLGGKAATAALDGAVSERLHPAIRNAKVYPEGRPVEIRVTKLADLEMVDELLAVKLGTR